MKLNTQKIYITFTMIYHFLHERMKTEKFKKLSANLLEKKECITDITNLKQPLNYGLESKKLRRVIKFN